MDIKENKKADVRSKPDAGTRDPKDKQGQLEDNPITGRDRVPNTEDELTEPKENTTAQTKVLIQQLGPNYKGNTN
jgi:hypothetical protein